MAKVSKVPVQKGPIVAHQKTQKFSTVYEKAAEDTFNAQLKRDGMTLKLHTPKQR